jgi:hypothetical protein
MGTDVKRVGCWHPSLLGWIAALSGVLTCLLVFVKGGEYTRQVDVNTMRLGLIETAGSSTFQGHVKFDEEQNANMKARILRLEDAIINLGDIRSRLSAIETRLVTIAEENRAQRETLTSIIKERTK